MMAGAVLGRICMEKAPWKARPRGAYMYNVQYIEIFCIDNICQEVDALSDARSGCAR